MGLMKYLCKLKLEEVKEKRVEEVMFEKGKRFVEIKYKNVLM